MTNRPNPYMDFVLTLRALTLPSPNGRGKRRAAAYKFLGALKKEIAIGGPPFPFAFFPFAFVQDSRLMRETNRNILRTRQTGNLANARRKVGLCKWLNLNHRTHGYTSIYEGSFGLSLSF
jgi:hypothetical protein